MRRGAVLVTVLVLAGCGGGAAEEPATPSTTAPSPSPSRPPCAPSNFADLQALPQLIGMPEGEIRGAARRFGYIWRAAGRDGKCASATSDYQTQRVNTYSEDGRVVWAKIY